ESVLLLKQKEEGVISGSVRTPNERIDASQIAEMFGGGGHVQAAGFKIESNDFEETEKMVLQKVREFQEKRKKAGVNFEIGTEEEISEEVSREKEIPKEKASPKKSAGKSSKKSQEKKENFTDFVIKASMNDEDTTEIEDGVIYKFEE